MWIDILEAAGGLLFAIVTIITGVTAMMRRIVDNRVSPVMAKLNEHDEQHRRERKQVAAAMARHGLDPPDGWNGKREAREA